MELLAKNNVIYTERYNYNCYMKKTTETKTLKKLKEPQTLLEAMQHYTNEAKCVDLLSSVKWQDSEMCCPKCGSTNVVGMTTRPKFLCREKGCKKQFSIKVGTIMEDSALPITKWIPAIWLIVNAKNGISSYELHTK